MGLSTLSASVSSLANGTLYYWEVNAADNSGDTSAWSAPDSFITALGGVPTITAPTNGAPNQPINSLTMSWTPVTGAATYIVALSTSEDFSSKSYPTVTGNTAVLNSLANNTTYWLGVRAVDQYDNDYGWSSFTSFTTSPATGVPTLSSPTDNAQNQAVSGLTLSWTSGSGGSVTSYAVQVSTGSSFSSTVYSGSGLTGTSQALPTLVGGTMYYWDVSATGPGGASSPALDSFTTAAAPGVPSLASPTDNAQNQPINLLTLSWTTASNAATYAVQVSTGSSFATTVTSQTALTVTSASISGLANATAYYWRAGAKGVGGVSGWSTVYSFTTIVAAPGVPTLSSPTDNALNQPISGLTLSWTPGTGGPVTSYAVQVSTGSSFSSTVYSGSGLTGTSQALPTLVSSTKYYWEVTATGNGGTSSAALDSFMTAAMPGVPSLSSPSNGMSGEMTSLTLSWTTASNAATYAVQVSTSSSFATTVTSQTALTVTSASITGLANNTIYYWRAGAKGAGGTSGWASAWSFSTSSTSVLPPVAAAKAAKTTFAVKGAALVYSLNVAGPVEITFCDLLGRNALSMKRTLQAGNYTMALKDFSLAAGRYIVQFKAAGIEKRQVVLIQR
jgi:hypothetical protein